MNRERKREAKKRSEKMELITLLIVPMIASVLCIDRIVMKCLKIDKLNNIEDV